MFEIPARELYCPVVISGLIRKLIYCKQTVRLLEVSYCLSHLVCKLTLINIYVSPSNEGRHIVLV